MAEQKLVAPAVVEEDLFAHIDDLLDFPDDADVGDVLDGWGPGSELLCSEALLPAGSGSDFSRPDTVEDTDLAAGLSVPTEDIPEFAWLSSFVEDSFSAGSFGLEEVENNQIRRGKDVPLRTSSPISVLDSTSSTTSGKFTAPLFVPNLVIPTRARTKRPRRKATVQYRRPLSMVSPTSSTGETDPYASLRAPFLYGANFSLELDSYGMLQSKKKAFKKKAKSTRLFVGTDCDEAGQPVRKCTHCEIQKTPQWRAGPMGPKTLCNACGVRYKSGRLFPEYRPAASPTYVSARHSNSHKKVLEMRNQMGQHDPAPMPQVVRKTSPFCSSSGDAKNSWLISQKMAA